MEKIDKILLSIFLALVIFFIFGTYMNIKLAERFGSVDWIIVPAILFGIYMVIKFFKKK